VHANFIQKAVFEQRYNFTKEELNNWVACQTADSCSVNLKTARMLGFPHVNCHNHLLSNEVQSMVRTTKDDEDGPGGICAKIHETMSKVKASTKNTNVLRKLTKHRASINNETKWTGLATMLDKWEKMRDHLIEAADDPNSTFSVDDSTSFKISSENIRKQFVDINLATVAMQTKYYTLSHCRTDLDRLTAHTSIQHYEPGSHWYKNKLKRTYISPRSEKLTSPCFISGVVKIQEKDFARMSMDEIEACKALKLPGERTNNNHHAGGTRPRKTFKEVMADRGRSALKKHKLESTSDHGGYIDCQFILGSAAEVERCWSEARYILPNQRAGMAPEFFEAIMMLR
jgi:hypothetical protein